MLPGILNNTFVKVILVSKNIFLIISLFWGSTLHNMPVNLSMSKLLKHILHYANEQDQTEKTSEFSFDILQL